MRNTNSRNVKNEINNIQKLSLKLIHEISDVKCETFTSGARNVNYLFRTADLYFYENAFLVVGFFKIGKYKFYRSALLFSNNEILKNNKQSIKIISPKSMNLNSFNKDVYIEFGESNFTNTNVEIRIKNLKEEDKNLLKI
ncbi:MAG TPA: hypothetical protein VLY87_00720 [Flavobacterium sp.]|nr:hypothetical protein [Flavobacterium sp.]